MDSVIVKSFEYKYSSIMLRFAKFSCMFYGDVSVSSAYLIYLLHLNRFSLLHVTL